MVHKGFLYYLDKFDANVQVYKDGKFLVVSDEDLGTYAETTRMRFERWKMRNMLIVPIDQGLLYVRPLYVSGDTADSPPVLRKVFIEMGGQAGDEGGVEGGGRGLAVGEVDGEAVGRGLHLLAEGDGLDQVATVPRVGEVHQMMADLRFRRNLGDVARDALAERGMGAGVDQLEPVDQQIIVLEQADGRPPALPAIGVAAVVERGAEKADGDARFHVRLIPRPWPVGNSPTRGPVGS